MSENPKRSATLRAALRQVKPRPDLYRRLNLKSARANDLLQGLDPGTTERLARIGARILVPQSRGSERSAAMKVWTILRELHPEAFSGDDSDHAPTVKHEPTDAQGSEVGHAA